MVHLLEQADAGEAEVARRVGVVVAVAPERLFDAASLQRADLLLQRLLRRSGPIAARLDVVGPEPMGTDAITQPLHNWLGTAFHGWMANCSDVFAARQVANRYVVLADWLFTTPAVIV